MCAASRACANIARGSGVGVVVGSAVAVNVAVGAMTVGKLTDTLDGARTHAASANQLNKIVIFRTQLNHRATHEWGMKSTFAIYLCVLCDLCGQSSPRA
jgi:hypothetical protein